MKRMRRAPTRRWVWSHRVHCPVLYMVKHTGTNMSELISLLAGVRGFGARATSKDFGHHSLWQGEVVSRGVWPLLPRVSNERRKGRSLTSKESLHW